MDDQQDASTGLTDAVTQEASILDPLVKFMPGEDMIAAHKRAMKAREAEGDWRGGTKPLISFFGTDPAIASLSAASEPQPGLTVPSAKPRNFNAADYLRPTSQQSEEDKKEADEPDPASNAFQSRFQRFFGGPSPTSALTSGSPGVIKEREQTVFSPPIHSPPEILSPSQRSYGDTTDRDEAYKPDDHVSTLMGLLSSKVRVQR